MIKNIKKIIWLFCSLIVYTVIVFGVPQMAKAEETVILSGECGENANYELCRKSDETYVLTISGTGAIYNYGLNSNDGPNVNEYDKLPKAPWQKYLISKQDYINEIIIGEGITRIGSWNFAASKATKYSLPNTLKEIGYQAFRTGIHQDELILPFSVETIEDYAFNAIGSGLLEEYGADAGYVKKIVLPASLKTIGKYAFTSCDKLEEVEINGDTEIHSYAFSYCASLISVKMKGNVTRTKNAEGEV